MSYEGHAQLICSNGHYSELDCNDHSKACGACRAPFVWRNDVDDTNCDSWGIIPMESFILLEPAQTQACNLGHTHVLSPERYLSPTPEQTRVWRMRRDDTDGRLIPIEPGASDGA